MFTVGLVRAVPAALCTWYQVSNSQRTPGLQLTTDSASADRVTERCMIDRPLAKLNSIFH